MESARIMPPNPAAEMLGRARTRSFGSFEFEERSWACYLVTYRTAQRRWCGYLSFRPKRLHKGGIGSNSPAEVRTVDLFIESQESEIARRARSLGRPLLAGLLASALDVESRTRPSGARLRGWVHDALEHERGNGIEAVTPGQESAASLRSHYATYRLDQLAHLVGLIDEQHFDAVVSTLLDSESYSFRAHDRLQFAMLFVQKLEPLLPLPPFEVFVEDLAAHQPEYHRYHHDLHGGDGISSL